MESYKVKITKFFEAAHQLPDTTDLITKKCANLHGHTYHVVVTLCGTKKDSGLVLDFKTVTQIIKKLDHTFLNDIMERPTAENIAKYLHNEVIKAAPGITRVKVKVGEGYKGKEHTNYVIYENQESDN